jgi:retron-type reverse transcriptase
VKERRSRFVSSEGNASVRQLELPLGEPGDEALTGTRGEDAPVEGTDLLERVREPQNLRRALHQVRRNQGAPGIDGMTVDDLGAYLQTHWPTIRAALLAGTYAPQPVRRTEIPKPGGGTRNLGIPTVLDRCIEQAL